MSDLTAPNSIVSWKGDLYVTWSNGLASILAPYDYMTNPIVNWERAKANHNKEEIFRNRIKHLLRSNLAWLRQAKEPETAQRLIAYMWPRNELHTIVPTWKEIHRSREDFIFHPKLFVPCEEMIGAVPFDIQKFKETGVY